MPDVVIAHPIHNLTGADTETGYRRSPAADVIINSARKWNRMAEPKGFWDLSGPRRKGPDDVLPRDAANIRGARGRLITGGLRAGRTRCWN